MAERFEFFRLRLGPFEGPAIVIPPALPEDIYYKLAFSCPFSCSFKDIIEYFGLSFLSIFIMSAPRFDTSCHLPAGSINHGLFPS
jgi:hypothetical protein